MSVTKTGLTCLITVEMDSLHRNALANLCLKSVCRNLSAYHLCDHNLRHPYLSNPFLSLNNTDRSKWCSSTWEYTKSFIHSEGYKDTKSLEDLDLIGVFNIIKNCSVFKNYFSFHLTDRTQILQQVNTYLYKDFSSGSVAQRM